MKIQSVKIRNILIISQADIELSPHLNIVTGETGSGKSLFVTAIRLLLGDKAPKSLVGMWGQTGEIIADLRIEPGDTSLVSVLSELMIEPEGSILSARRVIGEKSQCFINDRPVTTHTFSRLFSEYIEISSQFENRELFSEEYQTSLLDADAVPADVAQEYAGLYENILDFRKEIASLRKEDDSAKRDYLSFQIEEIEELSPKPGEEETLRDKVRRRENREKLERYLTRTGESLELAVEKLRETVTAFQEVSRIVSGEELFSRMESVRLEADDVFRSFELFVTSLGDEDIDDSVVRRYDMLLTLFMKHGVNNVKSLLSKYEKMKEEVEELFAAPDMIARLTRQLAASEDKAAAIALNIRKKRRAHASILEQKVSHYLNLFGMDGVIFRVCVEPLDKLGPHGMDRVSFLVNTTGGTTLHPVSTLSGGELSRLLLALKLIDEDEGRVILFDEIDSNIGGEIATRAARQLFANARKNQILVITHFPQTAAAADAHFVIEKAKGEKGMSSVLRPLSDEERQQELARMMGDSTSDAHKKAAETLLKNKGA